MTNTAETEIVARTQTFVRKQFEGESTGHDWWHIRRVLNLSVFIAKHERAEIFTVQCAALLHDIADWKFHDGDESVGPARARSWLTDCGLGTDKIDAICRIVGEVSFKGQGEKTIPSTLEGKVVQDADRLDAIGAIGIARAFTYGGYKRSELHRPGLQPEFHATFSDYKKGGATTINHFYEKLLLLKDRMNTAAARQIAQERHAFMELYLAKFLEEWDGPMQA